MEELTKGFKDSDGKFHPITTYKGVRKSRDIKEKTKGVRLARSVTVSKKLPDFSIRRHTWGLRFEDGKVSSVTLGNMVDTGWYWSGKGDQFNTFMARMSDSEEWDNMVSDLREGGISIQMIKHQLLKNLTGKLTGENDDGLYALSGDNSRWKFGEDDDDNVIEGEFEHFVNEGELLPSEEKEFEEEFWKQYKSPTYERWLEVEGKGTRGVLIDGIKNAKSYDDLRDVYKEVSADIEEDFTEFRMIESVGTASWGAVEAIKARRKEKGKQI